MRAGRIGRVVFVVGLTMLSTRAGAGQSAYMAGGIGPTPVIEGRSADRNWFGMAGYSGRRGIGFGEKPGNHSPITFGLGLGT
jgi:hypothetical protein